MGFLRKLFAMSDDMPEPEEETVEAAVEASEEISEEPMGSAEEDTTEEIV